MTVKLKVPPPVEWWVLALGGGLAGLGFVGGVVAWREEERRRELERLLLARGS